MLCLPRHNINKHIPETSRIPVLLSLILAVLVGSQATCFSLALSNLHAIQYFVIHLLTCKSVSNCSSLTLSDPSYVMTYIHHKVLAVYGVYLFSESHFTCQLVLQLLSCLRMVIFL